MEIFLPTLMPIFVPGFKDTPDRMALAIEFSRVTFPFIFLISLTALYSGILNSFEKFAAVASSPMIGNIALILTVYAFLWIVGSDVGLAFSAAILVCGIVQLLWVVIPLARRGFVLSWVKPKWSSKVRHFFKLMAPAALGSGVVQLSIFIDTLIASLLPAGSISYIHYADRLSQLPLSVLGTAIGTALLPLLSKQIRAQDYQGAKESQNLALEYALLFTLPATIGLIFLAEPLIRIIFEHRAFQASSTLPTARTLMAFASGLPAYVLIKIFTTSFFARQDTKTPVFVAIFSVMANVVISLLLLKTFKHVGIALATSISAWMNVSLLGFILWRRRALQFNERFENFFPRVLVSSLLTILLMMALSSLFKSLNQSPFWIQSLSLILIVIGGFLGFFIFSQLTKAFDYQDFHRQFHRENNSISQEEKIDL